MLRLVEKADGREEAEEFGSLDELAREGARRMLVKALAAEVEQYLERYADERDGDGCALVVRNGKARARKVTLGAGTVEIRAPRVNDRRVDDLDVTPHKLETYDALARAPQNTDDTDPHDH